MNDLLRSMTLAVALAASLPALASEPTVATAAAPAATAPAANPAATDAAQPAAAPVAQAKSEPLKVPPGYKVKVIDGETRFCRKETPLGSRFPTETCMTQAQYQDLERNRDSMRNALQDRQKSYSTNN
jgi:hypothetical protein